MDLKHDKRMIISIGELENARKMFFLLQDMKLQIEYAYNTYHSPDMTVVRNQNNNHSDADQTLNAITKIEKLREYREILLDRFFEYQLHVMDKIQDPCLRALIIGYYFAGMKWKDCRVPGSPYSKQKMIEYIESHYKELNSDECQTENVTRNNS